MIGRLCWVSLLSLLVTSAKAAEPPSVWAIVIGIDSYGDAGIASNTGGAADARELRRWLTETAGWKTPHVLLMDGTSQASHGRAAEEIADLKPTKANLDWAVKEWLPYRAKPGDVVLIYFAGQALGGRTDDPNSRDLLIPIDAKAKQLDESGWILADAVDRLASRGENPILIWLDTSLSGRGKPAVDLKSRRTTPDRMLAELTRWPGTSTWIAASGAVAVQPATNRARGPFVKTMVAASGTTTKPINLIGSLFQASRDPQLNAQGFRAAGALGPNLALWPKMLAETVPPPSEFLLQRGHGDRVTGLAFSADGSTMVTASKDSTLKVWRVADRMLLRTLPAHMIGVTSMALSPDGSMLASGDGAGRVLLWSMSDFKPRRVSGPSPHEGGIAKVVFHGDNSGFAAIDLRGRVVLWKAAGRSLQGTSLLESATTIAADGDILAVALATTKDGSIVRIFDQAGKAIRDLKGANGRILADCLAVREDLVAQGDKTGMILGWRVSDGEIVQRFEAAEPVSSLALTEGAIIAGSGQFAWTIRMAPGREPRSVNLGGKAARVVASNDGRSAAATTEDGKVVTWRIPDEVVKLEAEKSNPLSTVVGFPPGGDRLVSGDQDGGMRFWEWPSGVSHSQIKPGRGKIDALAASPDGRILAQIDHDWSAKLWDLREGRGLKKVAGQWVSVAFAPDGLSVALSSKAGDIGLFDTVTTARKVAQFDRPVDPEGKPFGWAFGPVAISPDGKQIAAGGRDGPIAAIWPIAGGRPSQTIRDHNDQITSVSFSSDSRYWLTGSLDGTAKVWKLDADAASWVLQLEPGNAEDADPAVTACRIAPGAVSRVITGHRDGRVVVWELKANGQTKSLVIGQFEGPVASLELLDNGARVLVAGWDKTVRIWTAKDGKFVANSPSRLEPQHTEKVNAVVAPANGKFLASAGDDGSIRLWKTDGKALLGTISTSFDDGTWVAFDASGRFDSAPGGEVHVSYLQSDRVMSLDQSPGGRVMGLGAIWLDGKGLPSELPLLANKPTGLAIDVPFELANADEVELKVHLGNGTANELRLYQNDMPVRASEDFRPGADPTVRLVKVRLGAGENRFVAMAAGAESGAIHSRSNALTVRGPALEKAPEGRVHVLALGVSKYDSNALRYADTDASELARYLERNGLDIGRKPGTTKILVNDKVRVEVVEAALQEIRKDCKPEDTVVVFLAGHTDVRRDDRFCLLLDKFPFAPGALTLGQRGPIRVQNDVPDPKIASTMLPYATIYRTLSRLDARKRLVVIDACQAEAIFDDPAIQRIQRKTEDAAHESRTSYLLAARRGEPASEAAVLKHGLMTYLLLLGMGAESLEPTPGGSFGVADADGDKTITTEELRQYLDVNLPILSDRVVAGIPRANPNPVSNVKNGTEPIKARGATSVFPVVRLPRK